MRPVALVTGGAIRVGKAISKGLAAAGYDVVINYSSSEAAALDLARELDAEGHGVAVVQGDVSDEADARRIVGVARERFGRLDLLVNNASTFETGDLLTLSTSDWDRVMGVNVRGPFLMVREAAALLKEAGGSVVNIVDLSAFHPWVDYPHHSVSKAALLHLTRVMARSLAPTVRVNAIAPGTVLAPDNFTDADAAGDAARTPLGQIGTPEDVVRTVLFLAGSGFVTGEVITVDGGRHLRG